MKLKKISFKNFRLFENFDLEFPDENFIVLIGNNGVGKSSILDGISLCLEHFVGKITSDQLESHDIRDSLRNFDINEQSNSSELDIVIKLTNQEIVFNTNKSRNIKGTGFDIKNEQFLKNLNKEIKIGKIDAIPVFYYYDVKRSDYPGRTFNADKNLKNNLTDTYEKYQKQSNIANFEEWFVAESIDESIQRNENKDYESKGLRVSRNALNTFLANFDIGVSGFKLKKIEGQKLIPNTNLEYYFAAEKNNQTLVFNQLSSGEKAIIHLIADISRRLSIANSHSINSLNGEGIILIDEIDLHFHPSWQVQIVKALKATFPNIQFIVTTHSPLVLSGVRKEEIISLTAEGVIPTDEIPDIYGATAEEIYQKLLFSEIQISEFKDSQATIDKLIRTGKFEEAEVEIDKLKSKINSNPKWLLDYQRRIAFARA